MTKNEWIKQIAEWREIYGDTVSLDVLSETVNPSVIDYVRNTYRFDPIMRVLVNRQTGKVQTGPNISVGGSHSPITLTKGEWILRMGTDPWRVGRDDNGALWAMDGSGCEKVYA